MKQNMTDKSLPDLIGGQPGEARCSACWSSHRVLPISSIISLGNWVEQICTQVFADEKIVKKTADAESLRLVREWIFVSSSLNPPRPRFFGVRNLRLAM
jgi:hypothetical protein